MKQDTVIGMVFLLGFALINGGLALDKTSMVLAGCFYVWLAKELDP